MKFGFKKKGDWKKIRRTLFRRKERLSSMSRHLMRDLVKEFEREVKKPLSNTKNMIEYKKSIEPREIKGSMRVGEYAYALLSNPKPLEVSKLSEEKHVIYVVHEGAPTDAFGQLLIDLSPWVKSRLPENFAKASGVKLIHRTVHVKEVNEVRQRNDKALKDHERELRHAKAKIIKPKEEPKRPKSTPDIMFSAIRMEFGIMRPAVPHWKRAYDMRMALLKKLLKDKKKYTQYVVDADFNGWTQRMPKWKTISAQRFKTQYGIFNKKITGK